MSFRSNGAADVYQQVRAVSCKKNLVSTHPRIHLLGLWQVGKLLIAGDPFMATGEADLQLRECYRTAAR